jgi:uncharacterized protein YyaL (SSP411 family)
VDRGPNFEGRNILYVAGEPDADRIAPIRAKLYEARERRIPPGRDDKVLASWNGLACRAFAEAGRALGRADYIAASVKNAGFVLEAMRAEGRLLRTWKGGRAKLKGYLEDYAMVAAALLEVYEATFERRWLDEARALADAMIGLFWDEGLDGFYDTGSDHEPLIVRPRNLFDNAVPCGISVAVEALLRLAVLTGESRYEATALKALRPMANLMARHASGFGRFLCAVDFHLGPVIEIALVAPAAQAAPRGGDGLGPLVSEVFGRYLPNRVVTGMVTGDGAGVSGVPLLKGRDAVGGNATAYVCRNYACELPVTDRAALARQLDGL